MALAVGNIVVSNVFGCGTNRGIVFGIVTKVTPTGRLRIHRIESQTVQRQEIPLNPGGPAAEIRTQVSPNPAHVRTGVSYLTDANGQRGRGWDSIHFRLYDPNQQYFEVSDMLY